MTVCRTCLLESSNIPNYSIYQELEEHEKKVDSKSLNLKKMIERCIPEMVKLF